MSDRLTSTRRLRAGLVGVYRAGLWLLPRPLREKHGAAMVALLESELARAASQGVAPLLVAAGGAIGDLLGCAGHEWIAVGFGARAPEQDTIPSAGDAMPPITARGLLRQLAVPYATSFVAFTGLLLAQYLVRRAPVSRTVELLLLSVPFIAALTIPMALFVAMLWVSRRLRQSSPASSVSPSLLRAVLTVSLGVAAGTLALTSEIVPRANARLVSLLEGHEVARGDRSMTIGELQAAARATRETRRAATGVALIAQREREVDFAIEIHKKFVVAASCVLLALAGLVVGWGMAHAGLTLNTLASVGVFTAMYVYLMAAESMAEQLMLSPGVAMWSGTVVGLAIVALSLRRSSRGVRVA